MRNEINDMIAQLFDLPCAMPGITENVHHTLTYQIGDDQDSCSPTLQLPTALAQTKNP